jgi:NAD(P)-dependent dehydrogenase (short-subunit alcohol dehydrogenase family)
MAPNVRPSAGDVVSALADRVALVTGGGRGIGRATALALAREGCAVAIGARTRAEVDATARDIEGTGKRAVAVELDVSVPESVDQAIAAIARELGPIDVLVNNAGIAESSPFVHTATTVWERHLRVNVTGPFLVTRAVVPAMLERRWGRIANVASLAGLYGAAYVAAYVASKHALVGLTRALAVELAGKGVTVNAICPGYVATDMTRQSAENIATRTGKSYGEAVAALARMNPGHRLIHPDEVADTIVRIVSDETTNGNAVILDGSGPVPEPDDISDTIDAFPRRRS